MVVVARGLTTAPSSGLVGGGGDAGAMYGAASLIGEGRMGPSGAIIGAVIRGLCGNPLTCRPNLGQPSRGRVMGEGTRGAMGPGTCDRATSQ